MIKRRIFKIGIVVVITLLILATSVSINARQTKTIGKDLLIKPLANRIPDNIKYEFPKFEELYTEDAPEWADGYYLGFWFEKVGAEYNLLGYMAGFYHKWNSYNGYYAGVWNNTDNTTVGAMGGLALGFYTIGRIILSEENKIPYAGFLLKNETHYLGRIMSFVGDPVYMYGKHFPLV